MALDVYKDWLGIPDGPRPPDHYQLLRLVQFEDDTEKIRKNYKKLNSHVRKYATGQYAAQSQELLNELAKAMLLLTDEERKLDYDRGMGREIDDRDPTTGRRPMTAYLQDDGILSLDQIKEAKSYSERTGLSTRDALVQLKFCSPEEAARALAREMGRPYVDLADLYPDDAVLDMMPKESVKRHGILPLFIDDGSLLVACIDDPGHELEDEIRLRFGVPIRPVMTSAHAVNQGIAKYYAPGLRKDPAPATAAATTGKAKAKGAKPAPGGKGSANAAAAPAPAAAAPASEEQKKQGKQLGIILICWLLIGFVWLERTLLWDYVYRKYAVLHYFPFVLTALVGLPIAFAIYATQVRGR